MDQNNQENQFIPKKDEASVNALFEELGSELDFGSSDAIATNDQPQGKKHPLEWAVVITGVIVKILLVVGVVGTLDSTIRNLDSGDFLKSLPLCAYYAYGVENYENADCDTYSGIYGKLSTLRGELEKELSINLAILVPQKLLLQNTLKSPEVQYILTKTTSNRVSIPEILAKFAEYRTSATVYRGEDIECGNFAVSENGDLTVTCDFFGFSINGSSETKALTSRSTAIAFLDKLRAQDSSFRILNEPKVLEMTQYSSTDLGIKSTFTTKTNVLLKLRYIPSNRL